MKRNKGKHTKPGTTHYAGHNTTSQGGKASRSPVLQYNIFPFRLPNFVQAEYNLDEQQVRLYVEAMERASVSEILAYLMAAGLNAV